MPAQHLRGCRGAGRVARRLGGQVPHAPRAQGVHVYTTRAAPGPETNRKRCLVSCQKKAWRLHGSGVCAPPQLRLRNGSSVSSTKVAAPVLSFFRLQRARASDIDGLAKTAPSCLLLVCRLRRGGQVGAGVSAPKVCGAARSQFHVTVSLH